MTPWTTSPPGSSLHGILQGKNTAVGCHALLQGIFPNPGIEPGSPALQTDSLTVWDTREAQKKGSCLTLYPIVFWGFLNLFIFLLKDNCSTEFCYFLSSEVKWLSPVWLSVTPWTVAYQASPSMWFSRQEYWSGLPFPSPGDPPDPGIEPGSFAL